MKLPLNNAIREHLAGFQLTPRQLEKLAELQQLPPLQPGVRRHRWYILAQPLPLFLTKHRLL